MINLIGQRFSRLLVQKFAGRDKKGNSYWDCICDCGNITKVRMGCLKRGTTKSCGCLHKEQKTTHGQTNSVEFTIWQGILARCYNEKSPAYKWYGERGIKVCERWLGRRGFANFLEDMGKRPEGMTLDRKDNDGDYTPENCRWATWKEQQNNRRGNHWIEYDGERRTLTQWAEFLGISVFTLSMRLNTYGWSIKKTLTTPVRKEYMLFICEECGKKAWTKTWILPDVFNRIKIICKNCSGSGEAASYFHRREEK